MRNSVFEGFKHKSSHAVNKRICHTELTSTKFRITLVGVYRTQNSYKVLLVPTLAKMASLSLRRSSLRFSLSVRLSKATNESICIQAFFKM